VLCLSHLVLQIPHGSIDIVLVSLSSLNKALYLEEHGINLSLNVAFHAINSFLHHLKFSCLCIVLRSDLDMQFLGKGLHFIEIFRHLASFLFELFKGDICRKVNLGLSFSA